MSIEGNIAELVKHVDGLQDGRLTLKFWRLQCLDSTILPQYEVNVWWVMDGKYVSLQFISAKGFDEAILSTISGIRKKAGITCNDGG